MSHKNLLRISGLGLFGLLVFFQPENPEKEIPSPTKILSQPLVKNDEAKFVAFTALPLEKESVQVIHWHSECGGYQVRNVAPLEIQEYKTVVERSTCAGYTEKTIRCESITASNKENESHETDAEKKVEPVKESRPMSYKIYPNPMISEARLEIENYNDEPYQFELYDLTGKLVMKEFNINNSVYIIPRNDLSTGIYIYRVLIASNNVLTLKSGKIVVE